MATITVWAFKRLPELNDATALVDCDEELAKRLIAEGLVQDPTKVSALELKEIESYETTQLVPGTDYRTTNLTPPAKGGRKRDR